MFIVAAWLQTTAYLRTLDAMMKENSGKPVDVIQEIRDDFRHHLETFYADLQLAPPYHTIEQALMHLTGVLKAMSPGDREQVRREEGRLWTLYCEAFTAAGLHRKHRGIIRGMRRSGQTADLPGRYHAFLDAIDS